MFVYTHVAMRIELNRVNAKPLTNYCPLIKEICKADKCGHHVSIGAVKIAAPHNYKEMLKNEDCYTKCEEKALQYLSLTYTRISASGLWVLEGKPYCKYLKSF